MNIWYRRRGKRGFTLVELLAVVLVLAVLAAVAIPLYINTRRSSAARACKQNLATIATAMSAFATRFGQYSAAGGEMTAYDGTVTGGLIGAPEGLTQAVTCPLNGAAYTITEPAGDPTGDRNIACPNAATHALLVGTATDYSRDLPPPADEAGIP